MLFKNFIFRNFLFVVVFIKKGLLKASEKDLKYALYPQNLAISRTRKISYVRTCGMENIYTHLHFEFSQNCSKEMSDHSQVL